MESSQVEIGKKVDVLGVRLDIVPDEELEERVLALANSPGSSQVVLLGLWDFVRARGRSPYAKAVGTSALVLPTSRLVTAAAAFLRRPAVPRYMPFDFIIRVLAALETRRKSVYLIGSRPESLHTAAANLRGSFPGLHVVGRCAGFFPPSHEPNILLAIRKAAPTLLLAGRGLPGRDMWLMVHKKDFAPGLTLWSGDCIDVFSGKRKRASREAWRKGVDFVPELIRKPWRVFRGFAYLGFLAVLLIRRLRKL